MTPISSMWPASITVGVPPLFTSARLLPATSPDTLANFLACSRQTFAGAASNPDGPGVSRSFFRKERDSGAIVRFYEGDEKRSNIALNLRHPQRARTTLASLAAPYGHNHSYCRLRPRGRPGTRTPP